MKMTFMLYSQSMCEKVPLVDGGQSPLAAFYSLQLGWMKNHLLGLNYNLVFSLLLPLKMINGPLFQQLIHVVQHCFNQMGLMTFFCQLQLKRTCLKFTTLPFVTAILGFAVESHRSITGSGLNL